MRTGNTYFIYAHLEPSSIRVGTHVEAGQVIGRIEGNHLHFEARTHGANLVEIGRHTGDYMPEDPNAPLKLDKPLLVVDPKLYFNPEMASAIDHGIAQRDRYVDARGISEEGYQQKDADVRMIDLGSRAVYREINWLDTTDARLWGKTGYALAESFHILSNRHGLSWLYTRHCSSIGI